MSEKKYTHMKALEEQVISMRESGMTWQETADKLGLDKIQIKNCIYRYNRRRKQLAHGYVPRPKGRPVKDSQVQDPQKELERLRMENKLLRDFLQSTERM